jgi:hypothetical protein
MKHDRTYIDKAKFQQHVCRSLQQGRLNERAARLLLDLIYNIGTGRFVTKPIPNHDHREEIILRVVEKVTKVIMRKIESQELRCSEDALAYCAKVVKSAFRDEFKRLGHTDSLGEIARFSYKDSEGNRVTEAVKFTRLNDLNI